MYSRIINGEEFSFGVSGKLIRNVLVMYDRQTGTLWSQLIGEAVEGPLQGTVLEYVPAVMTTWEDWKAMHPESIALKKGYYGDRDPYRTYYQSGSAGVIGETFQDDRLYIKEFVIGVDLGHEAVAFPFSVLNEMPVVNYDSGDDSILILFSPDTGSGRVFDRNVGAQTLTFESIDGLTLMDVETKSIWDGINGVATEGVLAGLRLTQIKSTSSFWFGWKDFHPDTLVYGSE